MTCRITSHLPLGPIAGGALSELALNYNVRAEILAQPAVYAGQFTGVPLTERNSLKLFEEDGGFQLKRDLQGTTVDLLAAARCVHDALKDSHVQDELVEKLGKTLEVIDYVRAGTDTITADKIKDEVKEEQARIDAHNIALTLETALLLTVEDTTVWGKVMPSAAFQVFPKAGDTKADDKATQARINQAVSDAQAADAKTQADAVAQARAEGKAEGLKEGGATGHEASGVDWKLPAGIGLALVVGGGFSWLVNRRRAGEIAAGMVQARLIAVSSSIKATLEIGTLSDDEVEIVWRLRNAASAQSSPPTAQGGGAPDKTVVIDVNQLVGDKRAALAAGGGYADPLTNKEIDAILTVYQGYALTKIANDIKAEMVQVKGDRLATRALEWQLEIVDKELGEVKKVTHALPGSAKRLDDGTICSFKHGSKRPGQGYWYFHHYKTSEAAYRDLETARGLLVSSSSKPLTPGDLAQIKEWKTLVRNLEAVLT